MAEGTQRRGAAPVRLVLTRRAREDPVHGWCGVCFESRRFQQLAVFGADELAICRACYEAAAHFTGATAVTTPAKAPSQNSRELGPTIARDVGAHTRRVKGHARADQA